MTESSRRIVLTTRPTGLVDDTVVHLETVDIPTIGPGQALIRNRYLSIDPTIRTWMDDAPGYLPPIGIGEVIRSGGIGEDIASESSAYNVGDMVFGMVSWQDHCVADEGDATMQVIPGDLDPKAALSVFGVTGVTAYFGLLDIGRPQPGDTVVVSGAAGATGSVVGQIAKIKEAGKVIGIAGGPAKCAWLVDELGFDAAIDYRSENVQARLAELCPDGIDIYFDNVGGEILDAALANLAMRGRVVLCGAISQYNDARPVGPANYLSLLMRRGRMEGFIILDYLDRFLEAQVDLFGWVAEGKVKHAEHVVPGLENAADALNLLFTGGNTGKVIVEI